MMFLFLSLLVVSNSAIGRADEFPAPDFLEAIKPVMDKCREETQVDKEILQHFSEGKMPEDTKLKCYMKCIFLQFEVLDPTTGLVHYEKMMGLIPESMKRIAYNMGKNCVHFKGEGGADLCQVSYDIHKCWQQADPEDEIAVTVTFGSIATPNRVVTVINDEVMHYFLM